MEDITFERASYCALNRIFGYDPIIAHKLTGMLGSAGAVFGLTAEELDRILGPFSKYKPLISPGEVDRSAEELIALRRQGVEFICRMDDCYPELLAECDDAPVGLYLRSGTPPELIFGKRPQIAVVGTRDISFYGKEWCRKIVTRMSTCERKPMIISGFALGTDIIAHSCALECGLPTVAVLPCGIDSIYPSQHHRWAGRMLDTDGCALITDYPPGTRAIAINFLRRNRIIAGLASATILIESKSKGGGLITTDFAFNYNRNVFALPGRIDDVRSMGCNRIIRCKMADPIEDLDVLMRDLGLGKGDGSSKPRLEEEVRSRYSGSIPPEHLEYVISAAGLIRRCRGISIQELQVELGCSYSEASYITELLETDGFIETDLLQRCNIKQKIK